MLPGTGQRRRRPVGRVLLVGAVLLLILAAWLGFRQLAGADVMSSIEFSGP